MIADDLFAGAGGWDLAAAHLGIHARGVENMPEARATRDAAGLTTVHDDVWTFRPRYTARHSGMTLQASGLIASPPCQTFSAAGKGSGRKALDDVLALMPEVEHMSLAELREAGKAFGDDRTALVLTPLWFALHHPYQWLAWEQVPTVLPVWQACADLLHVAGWSVWTGNLHAEQYGVPQTRKRAFLLASRTGDVAPPTPTHSRYYSHNPSKLDEGVEKWVSMAEALGSGTEWVMRSNYGTGGDASKRGVRLATEPSATVTSKVDRNRVERPFDAADEDIVYVNGTHEHAARRPADRPAPTVMFGARSNGVTWEVDALPTHMGDVYNSKGCVRSVDEPAPTMTASMDNGNFRWHSPAVMAPAGTSSTVVDPRPVTDPAATITGAGNAEWGERPTRAPEPNARDPKGVRVTVHEAGVLQSFPADYPWQGAKGKQYLQAGNAVPPGLALHALAAASGVAAKAEERAA